MPCLIEAFKQMRRQGLVARRECYCEHCGEDVMREAAHRWHEKQKDVRGFVHVGEWDPPTSPEDFRVPLVFGSVDGGRLSYRDPGCVAVGEVVASCLDEQGILYDWNRVPGNPILVLADDSLTGIPPGGSRHATDLSEDHRVFRNPTFPESAFDKVAGNPVRLLNLTKLRRLNVDAPHLHGTQRRPSVGERVKLGFLVWDAIAPEARKEMGEMIHRVQLESMWVEVTGVLGQYPQCVYRGEVMNVPMFLDPAQMRIGSPVNFTPDQIYPVERTSRRQARRWGLAESGPGACPVARRAIGEGSDPSLTLHVDYHEGAGAGDRYHDVDGVCWTIEGAYQLTPAGNRFKDKVERRFFVDFG